MTARTQMCFSGHTPEVRLGDGIAGLAGLDSGTVGLLLSDLPSGETQAAFDRKPDLEALWSEAERVLAPDGVAVLMASSLRFAAELMGSHRWYRYDLVWVKSVATGFLNASSRPLRAHEFVLVFHRPGGGRYEPQMTESVRPINAARRVSHGANYGDFRAVTEARAGATDRFPRSVLPFPSVGTSAKARRHPQQKPVSLMQWIVRTYSPAGGLVVDPFAGSGSAGHAALAEGRHFIGWDTCPEFAAPTPTPEDP